jgi:BRCT domain type II-containing protein
MKQNIIKFCKNKCCPVVTVEHEQIILGDKEGPEGITTWSKNQFKDFIEAAKEGKFDEIIKEVK